MKNILLLAFTLAFNYNINAADSEIPVKSAKLNKASSLSVTVEPTDVSVVEGVDCEEGTPCKMVNETSRQVLDLINAGSTSQIVSIVTPHFDFTLMTKYALGQNWKKASAEQQTELVSLFKQLLISTYSTALSKFKGSKISITNATTSGKKSSVISQVTLPSDSTNNTNQPIKVEYNLANTTGSWKAYDIKIENASLVTTYRNQFNEIVQEKRIDGLIKQLNSKVSSLKKSKSTDNDNS